MKIQCFGLPKRGRAYENSMLWGLKRSLSSMWECIVLGSPTRPEHMKIGFCGSQTSKTERLRWGDRWPRWLHHWLRSGGKRWPPLTPTADPPAHEKVIFWDAKPSVSLWKFNVVGSQTKPGCWFAPPGPFTTNHTLYLKESMRSTSGVDGRGSTGSTSIPSTPRRWPSDVRR